VTRARLLDTGLPAPFERDPNASLERRGVHAAVSPAGEPTEVTVFDPDDAELDGPAPDDE
jgi:hypothetical protein